MRFALFVVFIISACQSLQAFSLEKPTLYNASDVGISILTSSNLTENLYNKSYVQAFQFFNSWCGHCVRFSPTWKKFARDIWGWSKVVRLSVLDCSEDENIDVCGDYEVQAYPSVRFFWTNVSNSSDKGTQLLEMVQTVGFLRETVLKYVLENWDNGTYPDWPNLQPLNESSWKELQPQISNLSTPLVLVVDNVNSSKVAEHIILDYSNYTSNITLRKVSKDAHFLLDLFNGSLVQPKLPFLVEVNKTTLQGIIVSNEVTTENERDELNEQINRKYFGGKLQLKAPEEKVKPTPSPKKDLPKTPESPLVLGDLYGALQFSLYNQIPLKKHLNRTQQNVLERFLRTVHLYFPFDDEESSLFIQRLLNKTGNFKEENLPIETYLATMKELDYDFKNKFEQWQTCRGSLPNYRGYPCSMWSLFHTLTVREFEHANTTQKWVNLHETLFAMRDYIGTFFSCTHCAQHFTSMASNLETELQYPNSSVLWLWKAHNKVNARLKGDITEDPEHPKQQYPTHESCKNCLLTNGTFDESQVFNYLLKRYSFKLSQSNSVINTKPMSEKLTYEVDNSHLGSGFRRVFNYTDISICFTLYFLTTVLLFTIFFYLRVRNRRKGYKYSKTRSLPTYYNDKMVE